ncbi:SGNH/GDSL hydrolase family protein [Lactiplantibacillus plantarum]|nr:SGNH/GDSL hydrolase family protein [Lactiplantibacillus plantarum]
MERLKTNELSLGLNQTFRNDLVDNFEKIQKGVDGQSDSLNKQILDMLGNVAPQDQNEVTQARIDGNGKLYDTLKGRADATQATAETALSEERDTSVEVQDARTNSSSQTYPTLKERLDNQENDLNNSINDKLATIRLSPEAFANEAALRAKYPQGNDQLNVTTDNGHLWIWMDGEFKDCGQFQAAGIDQLKLDQILSIVRNASQNILLGYEIENWTSDVKGASQIANEPYAQYANTTIMHITGTAAEQWNNWTSPEIPVANTTVSIQIPEMIANQIYGSSNCYLSVITMATGESLSDQTVLGKAQTFTFTNQKMELSKFENVLLPANTVKIAIRITQYGSGDVYFGIPTVNYGKTCIAYNPSQQESILSDLSAKVDERYNKLLSINQDILAGSDITKWSQNVLGKVQLATDVQYHSTPIMHMTGTESGQWNHLVSEEIPVDQTIISVQLPEMVANEVYGSSNVYLSIVPLADGEKYGDQSTTAKTLNLGLSNSTIGLHSYPNLNLPVGTKKIVIDVVQYGIGDVYVGKPIVNYGTICIPYDQLKIAEKFNDLLQNAEKFSSNLLYGMSITDFISLVNGKVEIATEANKQFAGTTIMHITGTANDQWNNWRSSLIPVPGDTISVQLPEMSENEIYGSSNEYMQIYALADGENISSPSAQKKSQMFVLNNSTMKLGKFENIKLPEDTKNIVIDFIQYGLGDLYFGIPTVNYGTQCIPYNQIVLSQNLADALNNAGGSTNSAGNNFIIPEMHISADSGSFGYDKKPVPFKFLENGNIINGYLGFDIQGDSSRSYSKKNFKIKLYTDTEGKNKLKVKMHSSWSKSSNYNLKANWIDATHSRNIVNARLIKNAVSVTPLENPDQTEKILSTEGLGQIDGFPIELYFNDGYNGLYTLNTKKDETTFGMNSKDATNEVLSTELGKRDITDSTKAIIDGKNWSTEIHDVASNNVKNNLVKFLDFIEQSNDTDFRANLKNYIDVSSVINLILFGLLSQEYDFYSKSELFATWNDGGYWYLIPYDLDSTWGLSWDGSDVAPNRDDFDLSKIFSDPQTAWAASANDNKFQQRVINLFKPEIKKQGNFLRSTVWSTPNIIANFKTFIDEVPTFAYQRDQEKWTTIPSKSKTDFIQLQSAIIQRGQEFDNFLSQLA